jgi:hypothetical protein
MAITRIGRKKAPSVAEKMKAEQFLQSPLYPLSDGENSDNGDNEMADYGIIIVKKFQEQATPPLGFGMGLRKKDNGPSHRGYRATKRNAKAAIDANDEPGGIVNRLTTAFCGACISENSNISGFWSESSFSGTAITASIEDCAASKSKSSDEGSDNAIGPFMQEVQQRQDVSVLTDVSFLTDGSLKDLEMNEDIMTMPESSDSPKNLPAFRKLNLHRSIATSPLEIKGSHRSYRFPTGATPRESKRNERRSCHPPSRALKDIGNQKTKSIRRPSNMLHYTRENPLWKTKVGGVFKTKKRKILSSSGKKKPTSWNESKPDRRMLV